MTMCLPHCQFVVLMRSGAVEFQGPPSQLSDDKVALYLSSACKDNGDSSSNGDDADADFVAESGGDSGPTQDELNAKRVAENNVGCTDSEAAQRVQGRLVEDEVRLQGLIKLETWKLYLKQCGGWPFVVSCLCCIVTTQLLATFKDYYLASKLGRGTNGGDGDSGGRVLRWLVVYLAISFLSAVISALTMLWTYSGSLRASVALHDRLLRSIIHATPRFLETTPIGRMMARFAKDIQVIDTDIMEIIFFFLRSLVSAFITLVVISSAVPLFTVVGLAVLLIYADLTWTFMQAQRECKRLEATSFAPMISLYSEMIPGCDTIRAFDMHQAYMEEMRSRFMAYLSADFILRSTRRWLGMRIGIASSLVSFSTAMFILLSIDSFNSGLAGFVLIYAVNFWTEAIAVVRRYSDLELSLNCVERAHQYMVIDQEAASATLPENQPAPAWPSTGTLIVKDLVAGYTSNTPVLHGVSFAVRYGEKIGVVGRTGAGKSTLSLALLR
ncbi:Transporter of the ATP-binding cassette (ABC), partial [Coemansia aciculifera]